MATVPPRKTDLIFIVRSRDMMVIDRRRAPLPTGWVPPTGSVFVTGSSDTDLEIVPNLFVWDGNEPPTFTAAVLDPPIDDAATQLARLESLTSKLNEVLSEVDAYKQSLGV